MCFSCVFWWWKRWIIPTIHRQDRDHSNSHNGWQKGVISDGLATIQWQKKPSLIYFYRNSHDGWNSDPFLTDIIVTKTISLVFTLWWFISDGFVTEKLSLISISWVNSITQQNSLFIPKIQPKWLMFLLKIITQQSPTIFKIDISFENDT